MKHPYFKFMVLTAAALFAWNCSDSDSSSTPAQTSATICGPAWILNAGTTYIIYPDYTVTDADGYTVGTFPMVEGVSTADLKDLNGNVLIESVDIGSMTVVLEANSPTYKIRGKAWLLKDKSGDYLIHEDGMVYDAEGNLVALTDMSTAPTVTLFSMETQAAIATANLTSLHVYNPGDKCTELIVDDTPADVTPVSSADSQGETGISSADQGGTTPTTSSASTTAKSSSSTAVTSSAAASSSSQSSAFTIKYVSGGKSGSGYATRYWDCCKPHCAWPENVNGGLKAHACDASGNTISDDGASSMCDGGNAGMCKSQIPIAVNDTLAFAFAATPGGENNCGKCFDLIFTGEGKYATDNHKALKGKHLIVISNNVGYDVSGGQFDVMIPGGGYGIFNGCPGKMGWGDQGAQYGGLLSDCETESNYTASKYKSCLINKCNTAFSSDATAKEGCLFLANWMNAAGNPLLNYKEVECPTELLNLF